MKKKLLFLMAAFALFVPSVLAAEEPTYDESTKALFANGKIERMELLEH